MNKMLFAGAAGLMVVSTLTFAKANQSKAPAAVQGEYIVKMKGQTLNKSVLARLGDYKEVIQAEAGTFVVVKSASAKSLSALRSMDEVEYVEPNYLYQAIKSAPALPGTFSPVVSEYFSRNTPTDPQYGKLWGLENTGANEPDKLGNISSNRGVKGADVNALAAWDITTGSKKVVVAVIDTGIDWNHPDLKNQMWTNKGEIPGDGIDNDGNGYIDDVHGWNASANNGSPMDGNAHGTHCAGTIGAEHNNGIGVAGVMADVELMAVKFLTDSGSGSLADAIKAIDYATKMNVDIMSNSWGGGGFSQALEDSIKRANEKGIVFTAAAGNDGTNNDSAPHYPSNYQVDNVISVASHTAQDNLSSFSCYGRNTVHVAAPGSNILSTTPNNQYKVFSGTSMATPHVTGVVGLLIAQEGRINPKALRERLIKTSTPAAGYRRKVVANGRVNAYNFLTNTRIPSSEPDFSNARTEVLAEAFETAHPYANNSKTSKTYNFAGAKFIKVVVEEYDLENNYDFVTLKSSNGTVVEKVSGKGSNYTTDYVEGDSFTLEFSSDSSDNRWGARIKEVKVLY